MANNKFKIRFCCFGFCAIIFALVLVNSAFSQNADADEKNNTKKMVNNFFGSKFKSAGGIFDGKIFSIDEENAFKEQLQRKEQEFKAKQEQEEKEKREAERLAALKRVDENAPEEFRDIVRGVRTQDMLAAADAADNFVDYMINLMFEVRQITELIGNALIKREAVSEEDMVGVGQYIDISFAEARESNYTTLKPTHKEAMKRITADPKHEAEIYYFFTLSCSYCRYMASDIERLWRVVQGDKKKLKMVALTLAKEEQSWIDSYREYTGMTLPIEEGSEVAKSFGIGFVPALVIVSPNTNSAYIKSGQQDFVRMYEFVRTVQGLPADITPELTKMMQLPIGQFEHQDGGKKLAIGGAVQRQDDNKVETSGLGKF